MITIRNAVMEDAEHILKIYDHYVSNTAVSFEYVTPSLEEFQGRMRTFMKRYPYLVIEKDGVIEGLFPPCGVCRQVMQEFCDAKTFQIIVAKSEKEYQVYQLKELLPYGFGPENLKGD